MSRASPPELVQAYQAIKSGDKSGAREQLAAYLQTKPNDADAWWLMAHATSDPADVVRCLERVLACDPGYGPAREKLARLRPATAPTFDPMRDFTLPPNLPPEPERALVARDLPDDERAGSSWEMALAAEPIPARAVAQASDVSGMRREAQRGRALMLLLYGVLAVSAVVLVALLVIEGLELYRAEVIGQAAPGTLQGDVFTVLPPRGWAGSCQGNDEAQICSFATERRFSLLDPYARGRQELGNEELLTTINRALFGDGDTPQNAVTGIMADYSAEDAGYEYVRQSISWQEGEYGSKQGRTSYIRGYDLWMEYDKENPSIDGETGYVYWLTGKDVTGEVLARHGYFMICDVYVIHDDRLLMLTVVGYSANSIDDLPRDAIEQMIQTIDFK